MFPSRSCSINLLVRSPKRYFILAAATTILSRAVASTTSATTSTNSCSSTVARSTSPSSTMTSYPLINKWRQSNDSWLLRFALPSNQKHLGNDPTLPTCISVHHNGTDVNNNDAVLKKSYSPVSHPSTVGTFDLLVKSYPPQPGGGVGHAICNLQIGQHLIGKLKSERVVHGSPMVHRRWDNIGLIAGGTGVAPLVQIIRIILEDDDDDSLDKRTKTKIHLLSINRNEEDILMKEELDELAKQYPDQLKVSYSLTGSNIRSDWEGYRGRGSVLMAREALPPPPSSERNNGSSVSRTMIFVCGTDGFRDMWAGPIARAPKNPDGSKGAKIQGPLLGLLKDAGYDASDVFKY